MSVSFSPRGGDLSVSFAAATPEATGETLAPGAASTVARPLRLASDKDMVIPEWKLDESAIKAVGFVGGQHAEISPIETVGKTTLSDTSLGLLPQELLEHNPSQIMTIAAFRSEEEHLRNSSPASLDRSTETVIRKPLDPHVTATLKQLVLHEESNEEQLEKTAESTMPVLPQKYLLPSPKIDDTLDERFSDFSDKPGSHLSSNHQRSLEEVFDFSDAPAQEFSHDFVEEAFGSKTKDNLTFIDAEERENQDKFRFIQEENMESPPNTYNLTGFSEVFSEKSSYDSVLEYLRSGTSRLGKSFDESGSLTSSKRPTFGFTDGISSPVHRPVAAISPATSQSWTTVSDQNSSDKSSPAPSKDVKEAKESIAAPVEVESESKDSVEEIDPPETRIEDHQIDFKDKTLEETIHETLLQTSGISADFKLIERILAAAPSGKDPKFYANLVLREMAAEQQKEDDKVVDSPSAFLPSFLEISQDVENITKENDLTPKIKKSFRHSSPIKEPLKPRNSFNVSCGLPKKLFQEEKSLTPEFPLKSDKAAMHWLDVPTSEDQFIVLVNTANSYLSVRLILRNSPAFYFRENWANKRAHSHSNVLDVRLPPGGKRDVFLTFTPQTSGEFYKGILVLKPQSKNQSKKSLKGVVPLVGFGGKAKIELMRLPEKSKDGIIRANHLQFEARNSGDSTGFIKVAVFSDQNLKYALGQDTVNIENEISVLRPGQKVMVRVSSACFLADTVYVVVIHGSDLARKVYCKTRKNDDSLLQHLMLGQQDFECPGYDGIPEELQRISAKDSSHFYEKVKWESFAVHFTENQRQSATPTFVQPQVEETFNESAFLTEDSMAKPFNEFEMALQTPSQPVLLETKGKMDVRKVPKKHHRKGIYIDNETVFFPLVEIGQQSTAKLSVHNRTEKVVNFEVSSLQPPFYNYHEQVEVKPRHYLNIPIRYSPRAGIMHEAEIKLTSREKSLTATLIGKVKV